MPSFLIVRVPALPVRVPLKGRLAALLELVVIALSAVRVMLFTKAVLLLAVATKVPPESVNVPLPKGEPEPPIVIFPPVSVVPPA